MLTSVRRLLVLALTVLLTLAGLGLTRADAAAAYTTVSGTLRTADGGALSGPVRVTLYTFTEPGDAAYPTPQDPSVIIGPGDDATFTLEVPSAGYYTVRARPLGGGGPTPYLSTWLGDTEAIATRYSDPGVIFVGEDDHTPVTGRDITLRQGVTITGSVRGTNGQPLADVTVTAQRWNAAGALEAVPGLPGAITDSTNGRWSMTVADGTPLSLSVTNRTGYEPWVLGGQTATRNDANTLLARQGATEDITLTPDWTAFPGGSPVQEQEACLQHALSGTADLGGLPLEVSSYGWIAAGGIDLDHADPLAAGSTVPALAPYWSDYARRLTWGVDGDTLCATWRGGADNPAYQVLVDRDGGVTYNYGTIAPNLFNAAPVAGWTDGTGEGHERVVLPGPYADADATGLVHGSRGSEVPGRYRFRFAGFPDTDPTTAPTALTPPSVSPTRAVAGRTLVADVGDWSVPGGDQGDLAFGFQWFRDGELITGATRPTLATATTDGPARYTVRLTVRRTGSAPVFARPGVDLLGVAPTAPRPVVKGVLAVGRAVYSPVVTWSSGRRTSGYQWFRDGVAVGGATTRSYVVRPRDAGHRLSVQVLSARAGYVTGHAVSRLYTVAR